MTPSHLQLLLSSSTSSVIVRFKSLGRLTAADWFGFVLSVLLPIGLAVAGGVLAARALPEEIESASGKKLWILGFGVSGLVALFLGLGQQLLMLQQREADQSEAQNRLQESKSREDTTQVKLGFLSSLLLARPAGLTDTDRDWIKQFAEITPVQHTNSVKQTVSSTQPTTPPNSLLAQSALGLSTGIREKIEADTAVYTAQDQKQKDDQRKVLISRGMSEQQAIAAVNPLGYGGLFGRQLALANISAGAAVLYDRQIRDLLSAIDSLQLAKLRGYDAAQETITAEEGVLTNCLSRVAYPPNCPLALDKLAAALKSYN